MGQRLPVVDLILDAAVIAKLNAIVAQTERFYCDLAPLGAACGAVANYRRRQLVITDPGRTLKGYQVAIQLLGPGYDCTWLRYCHLLGNLRY